MIRLLVAIALLILATNAVTLWELLHPERLFRAVHYTAHFDSIKGWCEVTAEDTKYVPVCRCLEPTNGKSNCTIEIDEEK